MPYDDIVSYLVHWKKLISYNRIDMKHHHVYVSARSFNNIKGSLKEAEAREQRESAIVGNTGRYLLAVERFFLQAMFPIF